VRVLGIDCGSARTGYGIIASDGRLHRMVAAGTICTNAKAPFEKRLLKIANELRILLREHAPDRAAVEGVFLFGQRADGAEAGASARRGAAGGGGSGVPLAEYSPLEVKTSVVGYGRAEKAQVQLMVQSLLKLDHPIESEDAADALAVAICHATHEATRARIEQA